jgi:hypothetical protein
MSPQSQQRQLPTGWRIWRSKTKRPFRTSFQLPIGFGIALGRLAGVGLSPGVYERALAASPRLVETAPEKHLAGADANAQTQALLELAGVDAASSRAQLSAGRGQLGTGPLSSPGAPRTVTPSMSVGSPPRRRAGLAQTAWCETAGALVACSRRSTSNKVGEAHVTFGAACIVVPCSRPAISVS